MGLVDLLTGQMLLEILDEETKRLAAKQASGVLTGGDVATLEKLAKVFHVLKTEDRESEKGMGKLSDGDLNKLADAADGSDIET